MLTENSCVLVVVRVGQTPYPALCMNFHLTADGGKLHPAPKPHTLPWSLSLLRVTGGSQCNEIGKRGLKSAVFKRYF